MRSVGLAAERARGARARPSGARRARPRPAAGSVGRGARRACRGPTTITSRRVIEATTFSRSSAPPPPLIMSKRASISSAPSIVRSIALDLVQGRRAGCRSSRALRSVSSEVGTPRTDEALVADALRQPHQGEADGRARCPGRGSCRPRRARRPGGRRLPWQLAEVTPGLPAPLGGPSAPCRKACAAGSYAGPRPASHARGPAPGPSRTETLPQLSTPGLILRRSHRQPHDR